jgi:ABC-type uncharacterized transport system auxiliary subunit
MNRHSVAGHARAIVLLLVVTFSVIVSACASVFDSQSRPPDEYLLETRFTPPARPLVAAPAVQVLRVQAAAGYDTQRILVRRADGRLEPILEARWIGTIPQLIEMAAVDALRAAGVPAQDAAAVARTPYALQLTVRRFEVVYGADGATPTVQVVVDALWSTRSDRRALQTATAVAEVSASANRRSAITAAFAAATEAALGELAEKTQGVTTLQQ